MTDELDALLTQLHAATDPDEALVLSLRVREASRQFLKATSTREGTSYTPLMPSRNGTQGSPVEPIGSVMRNRRLDEKSVKQGLKDELDETNTLIPDYVHQTKPSDLETLPIDQLFVDFARHDGGGYARPLNEYNINRILRHFNPNALSPAIVSDRGEDTEPRYAVMDGSHRIAVARRVGLLDYPCQVKRGLRVEEEAALYTLYGVQFAQSPGTRFRARLAAGEERARIIAVVCQGAKVTLDYDMRYSDRPMSTRAFVALERVYNRVGSAGLYLTLVTIRDFWGDDYRAYQETVITGASAFIERYHKIVDREYLMKRMRDLGLSEMLSRANGVIAILHGKRPMAFGRAMQLAYNEKLTAESRKLPEWVEKYYIDARGRPQPAKRYQHVDPPDFAKEPDVHIDTALRVTRKKPGRKPAGVR